LSAYIEDWIANIILNFLDCAMFYYLGNILINKKPKEMFWSRSFCLTTTGGATIEMVKQYIEKQGRK